MYKRQSVSLSDATDMDQPHFMLLFSVPSRPLEELLSEVITLGKCFVVLRHDPKETPDIPSEYETVHYHLLVRAAAKDVNYERAWVRVRDQFRGQGEWFKSTKCYSLHHACAYLQMPGKEIVMNHLNGETKQVWDNVSEGDIQRQIDRRQVGS